MEIKKGDRITVEAREEWVETGIAVMEVIAIFQTGFLVKDCARGGSLFVHSSRAVKLEKFYYKPYELRNGDCINIVKSVNSFSPVEFIGKTECTEFGGSYSQKMLWVYARNIEEAKTKIASKHPCWFGAFAN